METNRNAYELAILAECASPDTLTSPGAKFLERVQDNVRGAVEYDSVDEDAVFEVADIAPNIYTYQLWQEFTDLAGWQEDIEEFGPITDMEQGARLALYQIAERLAMALLAEAVEEEADDEDEDEEG